MSSSRQVLAEAQAAHGGDRMALLAAINNAVAEIQAKRSNGAPPIVKDTTSSTLLKNSQVNS